MSLAPRRSLRPRPTARPRSIPSGGAILLEALVGLIVIGACLFLTLALFAQEPGVVRRLDAHLEVISVLDLAHERVRSGATLPRGGSEPLDWQGFDPVPPVERAEDLRLWIEVGDGPVRDLDRVTLRARYHVGAASFERTVETLVARRAER